MTKSSVYEYSDVFPLVYLKMRLEGTKPFSHIKHLLIDEMQDYTPVQYRVISQLFSCNKTILGDSNQAVNPYTSSSTAEINKVFVNAKCLKLCKSYRSTFEITEFAQRIHKNDDLIAIERHGETPRIVISKNKESEVTEIKNNIKAFLSSGYNSMGIICKTRQQAEGLYHQLAGSGFNVNLLTVQSSVFTGGIIITTAHMSKGLEFDYVTVPFCSADNYKTIIDKYMLYIACTRAMHRLDMVCTENLSEFIPGIGSF